MTSSSESDSEYGRTIDTVETNFAILQEIKNTDGGTISAIADVLDLSQATVHHHLATLRKIGYVKKEGTSYYPSNRFLTLGGRARKREAVFQIGRDYIEQLSDETDETVRLVVNCNDYALTLYQDTGDAVEQPRTYVGDEADLHSSASGKACLAHLPPEKVASILDERPLTQYTENTITDREELLQEIDEIRQKGLAFDDRERFPNIWCVSVPMLTETGDFLGAVTVSAPTSRRDRDWFHDEIPGILKNASGVIEVSSAYAQWTE